MKVNGKIQRFGVALEGLLDTLSLSQCKSGLCHPCFTWGVGYYSNSCANDDQGWMRDSLI